MRNPSLGHNWKISREVVMNMNSPIGMMIKNHDLTGMEL